MEVLNVNDQETWLIEADDEQSARAKADDRVSDYQEIGGDGHVEFEGVRIDESESVAFKEGQTDDDVGAIYEFTFYNEVNPTTSGS